MFKSQAHHHDIPSIRKFAWSVPEDEFETASLLDTARSKWLSEGPAFRKIPFMKPAEIEKMQLENVRTVVDFAFRNVLMYRELYADCGYEPGAIRTLSDLEALPIINKDTLLAFDLEQRTSAANGGERFVTSTSGSSGKALDILYGLESLHRETFEYYRQFDIMLEGRADPNRWIYNLHMSRGWMSSLNGLYPTFTLHEVLNLNDLAQHVTLLRPQVFCMLSSYLKHLMPIADRIRDAGVELIVVNSETSSREERRYYSEHYGIPVRDEYSSCEVGVIAFECGHGRYHVNSDGLYMELVGEGEWGSVVLTDSRNFIMPLIRYDQGDIARWDENSGQCDCGQGFQCFFEVLGRKDDSFLRNDGTEIPSASLLNALDEVFTDPAAGLAEYRLTEQRDGGGLVFHYVPRDGSGTVSRPHLDRFKTQIETLYGAHVDLAMMPVDALPKLSGYKRRKVVSDRNKKL